MSKHTPEPWELRRHNGVNLFGAKGQNNDWNDWYVFEDATEKDAARIVACVNACAGMENPAEEIEQLKVDFWKIHKERTNAEREVTRLSQERDAYFDRLHELRADKARLIDALREAIPYLKGHLTRSAHEYATEFEQLLTEIEEQK